MELIVQGVFRSGTTILFRSFRQDPNLMCFYEPLHPDLAQLVTQARIAHAGEDGLFEEYSRTPDALDRFDPAFSQRYGGLGAEARAPDLAEYLDRLDAAALCTALQFNRASWMLPWLGERFPQAQVLHLVRDPRAVARSQIRRHPEHRSVLRGHGREDPSSEAILAADADISYYYADRCLPLAVDLGYISQDGLDAASASPLVSVLALWGAQVGVAHEEGKRALGDRYHIVRFERFASQPTSVLHDLYEAMGRPYPREVDHFASNEVHPPTPAAWNEDPELDRALAEAMATAGIGGLLSEFGIV